MSRLDQLADELGGISRQIRHCMDQAEGKVNQLHTVVGQIAATSLLTRTVWLGLCMERCYDSSVGPHDSGQVVQAALLLPEGFGVCIWDTEEYCELTNSPEGLEPTARQRFRPFAECTPTEKAFLYPSIDSMLEDLTDEARIAESRLDPGPNIEMTQFFGGGADVGSGE